MRGVRRYLPDVVRRDGRQEQGERAAEAYAADSNTHRTGDTSGLVSTVAAVPVATHPRTGLGLTHEARCVGNQ